MLARDAAVGVVVVQVGARVRLGRFELQQIAARRGGDGLGRGLRAAGRGEIDDERLAVGSGGGSIVGAGAVVASGAAVLLPQAARLSSMIAPVSTGMSFFMAMPPQSWMAAIQRSMVLSGVRRVVSSKCTSRPGFTSAPGHSAATSLSVRPSQPPFVAKG